MRGASTNVGSLFQRSESTHFVRTHTPFINYSVTSAMRPTREVVGGSNTSVGRPHYGRLGRARGLAAGVRILSIILSTIDLIYMYEFNPIPDPNHIHVRSRRDRLQKQSGGTEAACEGENSCSEGAREGKDAA